MTNERSRETNIGSLVLFDLSTLRSAIDGRYGDENESYKRMVDPEADDVDGLESELFDFVCKTYHDSEAAGGFSEQSLRDLVAHAARFTDVTLRHFSLPESIPAMTDVGLSLIHLVGDCVESGAPFPIENRLEVLKEVSGIIYRDLAIERSRNRAGDHGADGRKILFTNEARTRAVIESLDAAIEACKKPEYQISNNEKESANAQNDGNQRMWFCLAADGQLVILGDHSDFDAAEDAATSSGVEAIWIFDRITADSWVSTLTSPEAKMSLRDDCYPSAAEIIDVEYLIDSELIEHSERIWRNAAGKLHRKDGPAVESANGNKEWWVNGKLHREGLPAIERANGDKEWYQNGLRYREDGPSIDCVSGYRAWYRNGQLHREDGPAIEHANGDKAWCRNGVRHREDGPAIEYADGTKEYWINGDRHRDDGPAIERADGTVEYWIEGEKIEPNDDQPTEIMPNGNRIWRNANGELHRENGPAVDCVGGERAWYRNGKGHREDGPAIERADGTVEYWLNGEPVDPPKASGRPKPR